MVLTIQDELINRAAESLQEQVDSNIIFDILTHDWHKMEITFGKDRYHEHGRMEYWCEKNIGPGGWVWGSPKTWEGLDDKLWVMHSAFGNTTFAFKEQKHYNWFVLRWS
jgi:hypothetical protein